MTAAGKPPRAVHATETFLAIVTVLVILALLGATILSVVDAYAP